MNRIPEECARAGGTICGCRQRIGGASSRESLIDVPPFGCPGVRRWKWDLWNSSLQVLRGLRPFAGVVLKPPTFNVQAPGKIQFSIIKHPRRIQDGCHSHRGFREPGRVDWSLCLAHGLVNEGARPSCRFRVGTTQQLSNAKPTAALKRHECRAPHVH
jgi:hypothetical protein